MDWVKREIEQTQSLGKLVIQEDHIILADWSKLSSESVLEVMNVGIEI